MPNAVHICQLTASPPLIVAGLHSPAQTETVLALMASPAPRAKRNISNTGQLWLKAEPRLAKRHVAVPTKMAPRRPKRLLMGSESQAPLSALVISPWSD